MTTFFSILSSSHVVQAIIIGGVLAYLTAVVVMNVRIKAITTTVNGWRSSLVCGKPGNDLFTRAASSKLLPLVNSAEEAMYWTTVVDNTGNRLTGRNAYQLHFPAGQLPPNHAFWSITITDTLGYMVGNADEPHSVGDHSALLLNPDGSVDIFIQRAAPAMQGTNWLSAPAGAFKLTLRVYFPAQMILEGRYQVPPVVKVS